MKLISPFFSLMCAVLFLSGCETTDAKKKSDNPPPPPETEVPTSSAPVEPTPAPPVVDDGSGKTIPIKDLPTYKGYPYAIKTKWPGLVKSPYAQDQKLVDVSTLSANSPARCPHTGKIFIVP